MTQTMCAPYRTLNPQVVTGACQEDLLRVCDIMAVAPVTVTPGTAVSEGRALMQRLQIRHLPVLEDGHLVGIVTDRDIRLVLPSPATSLAVWEITSLLAQLTVSEVMTRFVMTVAPDRPVAEAVGRMLGQKVGALPVVENGQVVGILTRTDVLRAFRSLQNAQAAHMDKTTPWCTPVPTAALP